MRGSLLKVSSTAKVSLKIQMGVDMKEGLVKGRNMEMVHSLMKRGNRCKVSGRMMSGLVRQWGRLGDKMIQMKLKNENFVYGAWKIFEKYFNFEIKN